MKPSSFRSENKKRREQEIILLLNRQRPDVQEWFGIGRFSEIVGLKPERYVARKSKCAENLISELVKAKVRQGERRCDRGECDDHISGWQQALSPAVIELPKAEAALLKLSFDKSGNQKT